nr:hypothetical protein [uncultured Psychroserpens sp.]
MCNFNKGFILCICNDDSDSSIEKDTIKTGISYTWMLFKSINYIEPTERGRYIMPSSDIENGLTNEFVFEELNKRDCFDFEYKPEEGDNLFIKKGKVMPYLSFVFRDGLWIDGRTVDFNTEFDDIIEGKLKSLRHE